jgi:hypothetical protein
MTGQGNVPRNAARRWRTGFEIGGESRSLPAQRSRQRLRLAEESGEPPLHFRVDRFVAEFALTSIQPIGTTVFGSLPGVAPNEKIGSARSPENNNTNASTIQTHLVKDVAKGAVSISLTPGSCVSRTNEVPDHRAASLTRKQKQRGRRRRATSRCGTWPKDVHRCSQVLTI